MILAQTPLGAPPWPTIDPFLFCVHHKDDYPQGNGRYGPASPLAGRNLGSDFSGKDGWSMYHGQQVPGFPAHPHRGFETVTVVRRGLIDHSDSLGAAARFGHGDVQWLTAGRGIVHAEMFPLLSAAEANPLELFQIWLNLPARRKMCAPYFSMLWAEAVPRAEVVGEGGARTNVVVVAGRLPGVPLSPATPPPPPPDSWASEAEADLGIFTLRLEPGARFELPAAVGAGTRRVLYVFGGEALELAGQRVDAATAVEVQAGLPLPMANHGAVAAELLVLQGRPIGEPVAQYGPFVMTNEAEIRTAFADYQRTRFGGWPWPDEAPVHGAQPRRFATTPAGEQLLPPSA